MTFKIMDFGIGCHVIGCIPNYRPIYTYTLRPAEHPYSPEERTREETDAALRMREEADAALRILPFPEAGKMTTTETIPERKITR
jgi:hypothetical protein